MTKLKPCLKWAGGKRQLLDEIHRYLPDSFNTYYEPFVGAGALLFNLAPTNAVINDYNGELMNMYNIIKNNIEELINHLKIHINDKEYYLKIRALDREKDYHELSSIIKASRFIYLNKTCFNGLYRVNSKGYFNVPFANAKNPTIFDENLLRNIHTYFNKNNITINQGDFSNSLEEAKYKDFVYIDPPYDPLSETSSFITYISYEFDRCEQVRVKKIVDELTSKGVQIMISNSSTEFIKGLYKDYNIHIVQAKRSINSVGSKRGNVDEVLITNY